MYMTLNYDEKVNELIKTIEAQAKLCPVIAYTAWTLPLNKHIVNFLEVSKRKINMLEEVIIDAANHNNGQITVNKLADILCIDKVFVEDAVDKLINDDIIDKDSLPNLVLRNGTSDSLVDNFIVIRKHNDIQYTFYYEPIFGQLYLNENETDKDKFYAFDKLNSICKPNENYISQDIIDKVYYQDNMKSFGEPKSIEIDSDSLISSKEGATTYGEFWTYNILEGTFKCYIWDFGLNQFREDISQCIEENSFCNIEVKADEGLSLYTIKDLDKKDLEVIYFDSKDYVNVINEYFVKVKEKAIISVQNTISLELTESLLNIIENIVSKDIEITLFYNDKASSSFEGDWSSSQRLNSLKKDYQKFSIIKLPNMEYLSGTEIILDNDTFLKKVNNFQLIIPEDYSKTEEFTYCIINSKLGNERIAFWDNILNDIKERIQKNIDVVLSLEEDKSFIMSCSSLEAEAYMLNRIHKLMDSTYYNTDSTVVFVPKEKYIQDFTMIKELNLEAIKLLSFNDFLLDTLSDYKIKYSLNLSSLDEINLHETTQIPEDVLPALYDCIFNETREILKSHLFESLNISRLNSVCRKHGYQQLPDDILCLSNIKKFAQYILKTYNKTEITYQEKRKTLDQEINELQVTMDVILSQIETLDKEIRGSEDNGDAELQKKLLDSGELDVFKNNEKEYLIKKEILTREKDKNYKELESLDGEFEDFCIQCGLFEFLDDKPGADIYTDFLFDKIEKRLRGNDSQLNTFQDIKQAIIPKQEKLKSILLDLKNIELQITDNNNELKEFLDEYKSKRAQQERDQKAEMISKKESLDIEYAELSKSFEELNKEINDIRQKLLDPEELHVINGVQDKIDKIDSIELYDELILPLLINLGAKYQPPIENSIYYMYQMLYYISLLYGPVRQYNFVNIYKGEEYSKFDYGIMDAIFDTDVTMAIYGDTKLQDEEDPSSSWSNIKYIDEMYEVVDGNLIQLEKQN